MDFIITFLQHNFFICSFLSGYLTLEDINSKHSIISKEDIESANFIINTHTKKYDTVNIKLFTGNKKKTILKFMNWSGEMVPGNQIIVINLDELFCFSKKEGSDLIVTLYPVAQEYDLDRLKDEKSTLNVKYTEKDYLCFPDFPLLNSNIISSEDPEILPPFPFNNFQRILSFMEINDDLTNDFVMDILEDKNFYTMSTCDENGDKKVLLFHKDILSETLKNNHSDYVKVNGYEIGEAVVIVTEYSFIN